MRKCERVILGSALLLCGATAAHAQPAASGANRIPVRPLGPIVAVSRDTLGARLVVRALSDGSVLVGVYGTGSALIGQTVKLFDPTLQQVTVLRDSTQLPQLIPFAGDSTILLHRASRSMIIVDQQGRDARTIALPKLSDFNQLSAFLRSPRFDSQGSLVYQGVTPPLEEPTIERLQQPFLPDSAPLVRANFDTRRVDTIARIRIAQPVRTTFGDHGQNISVDIVLDPTATGDEWAMLSEGTVAIIRAHDYHIDWIDPDGTRRSTPRMPMDWRRITDARKQFVIDSMQPTLDSLAKRTPPMTVQSPDGPRNTTYNYSVIPPAKFPDYEPPIAPNSVRADPDGYVWIAPRTSAGAKDGGLLYDVVNRKGEIVERVQFPPGVALAGFGPSGAVYVHRVQGRVGFLERARRR